MPESQQPQEGIDVVLRLIEGLNPDAILDVGAGDGKWGRILANHDTTHIVDAVEVWCQHIPTLFASGYYRTVIQGDVREFHWFEIYGLVILGDVLEHLPRNDALELIGGLLEIGVPVILTVPTSPCPQRGAINPYEEHKDQWTDAELKDLGWKLVHEGTNEAGTVTIGTYTLGWPAQ